MKKLIGLVFIMLICFSQTSIALKIPLRMVSQNDDGLNIGYVRAEDTQYGLLIKPNLVHLQPGLHGFHLHEMAFCTNMGLAAGGHFDPLKSGRHLGPYNGGGHMGDLPVLIVQDDGSSTLPILAPRLRLKDLVGKTLIMHEGSDNYSDNPPMGGGGKRIACGLVPYH